MFQNLRAICEMEEVNKNAKCLKAVEAMLVEHVVNHGSDNYTCPTLMSRYRALSQPGAIQVKSDFM